MAHQDFYVESFKIPKGTHLAPFIYKDPSDGRIKKQERFAETDFTAITGDCKICHQFPCKHTAKVMGWKE